MRQGASVIAIAVAGLVALAVAMGIGRFSFTPLLPMMQEDAGVSVAAGGWLASANYIGYLIGALCATWIRIRAATAIRAGLIVIGLTTLGMGFTDHFAVWLILRSLAGIASAWVLVYASAWCLEKLAPLQRPVLVGVVFAGVGIGIAGAGFLCIALMRITVSSAQAWTIFGVLALLLSAMIWPAFGAGAHASSRDVRTSTAVGPPRWDRESIRLILCYGAFGFGYIIPATFLPVMAKQAIGDPVIFGLSWPIFGTAAAVSTLAAAVLHRFMSNRRLWMLSHVVMALGVALPVFWSGIIGTMFAALLVGGTFMVTTMVAVREARDVAPAHATRLIAAMTAAFAVGQIAGPILVSFIAGTKGDFSAALLIASFVLASSAFALSHRKGGAQQEAVLPGDTQ